MRHLIIALLGISFAGTPGVAAAAVCDGKKLGDIKAQANSLTEDKYPQILTTRRGKALIRLPNQSLADRGKYEIGQGNPLCEHAAWNALDAGDQLATWVAYDGRLVLSSRVKNAGGKSWEELELKDQIALLEQAVGVFQKANAVLEAADKIYDDGVKMGIVEVAPKTFMGLEKDQKPIVTKEMKFKGESSGPATLEDESVYKDRQTALKAMLSPDSDKEKKSVPGEHMQAFYVKILELQDELAKFIPNFDFSMDLGGGRSAVPTAKDPKLAKILTANPGAMDDVMQKIAGIDGNIGDQSPYPLVALSACGKNLRNTLNFNYKQVNDLYKGLLATLQARIKKLGGKTPVKDWLADFDQAAAASRKAAADKQSGKPATAKLPKDAQGILQRLSGK